MSNRTYCVLSDIGIATQTAGHVSMCNQSRVFWQVPNGQLINLSAHSLEQAWDSVTRQEIRQSLAAGVQHPNCADCWVEEKSGRSSQRQIYNERFLRPRHAPSQPQVIILKPGNVCNLACRHCAPHTSSAWYRDYHEVENHGQGTLSDFIHQFDSTRVSYTDDNPVWQQLEEWSSRVLYWDIYGAEPLLIKPLLSLLTKISRQGLAEQQSLQINTNGTVWHEDFNEVFGRFKSVRIGISIDGIGPQFEYMRYPAKWSTMQHNLSRYKDLAATHPNVYVYICITASLLNIWYLPDYIAYFNKIGWEWGVNILHDPVHLNMCAAPESLKSSIKRKLQSNSDLEHLANFIDMPVQNPYETLLDFVKITQSYDKLRNQSYADTFTEFWNLLKSELSNSTQ